MKIMIHNYTFDKTAQTVTFNDYTSIKLESVLLISNATDGRLIYNFADSNRNGSVTDNVLTLTFDTSAMSNTDKLSIFYEDEAVLPATADSVEDLLTLTSAIQDLVQQISFLTSVRGIAADLRVTLLSGALTTLGTVTTVSTVTTVGTLSNITSIGGISAGGFVPQQTNQAAIQSNINNIQVS